MDLRLYYRKVREMEATMPTPQVVVASLGTPDGGKPGVITEVPTPIAARMVVDRSARVATDAEAEMFRAQHAASRKAAEDEAAAARLHVVVVPANASAPNPPAGKGNGK
jgi:hypothetical protein